MADVLVSIRGLKTYYAIRGSFGYAIFQALGIPAR